MTPEQHEEIKELCKMILRPGRWSKEKALADRILRRLEKKT